jgi:hypothetical protein
MECRHGTVPIALSHAGTAPSDLLYRIAHAEARLARTLAGNIRKRASNWQIKSADSAAAGRLHVQDESL